MQDCQQKRCRDNLVENIPTTPSTNVEDGKFTLRDQGTQGKCFLSLINESPAHILPICYWPWLCWTVILQLFDNSICPLWLSHDHKRSQEYF